MKLTWITPEAHFYIEKSSKKPAPKYNIGDVVYYKNSKAAVLQRWWDGSDSWRYEINILRGKVMGIWLTVESSLKESR